MQKLIFWIFGNKSVLRFFVVFSMPYALYHITEGRLKGISYSELYWEKILLMQKVEETLQIDLNINNTIN